MKASVECLSCLVRQAVETVQRLGLTPGEQEVVVQDILRVLAACSLGRPAPLLAQRIHDIIRDWVQEPDPFRAVKEESNASALREFPRLQAHIRAADDPLAVAVRAAIAGNIIDYGVTGHVPPSSLDDTLARALAFPLDDETLAEFRREAAEARSILYLADNAGEIVFDRLLIECLPAEKLTLVVRGAPVLNDATRDDAQAAGLDALVEVIDNGADLPGTVLDQCPEALRTRLLTADVIIAKGQGNFETLFGIARPVYYLFVAKCAVVAGFAGCPVGTPVFRKM